MVFLTNEGAGGGGDGRQVGRKSDSVGWGDQKREIWEEAGLDVQVRKRPSTAKGS